MRHKIVLFLSRFQAFFQNMQSLHQEYYTFIGHVMVGCCYALSKGSRTTSFLAKLFKIEPTAVETAMLFLACSGFVDFQPQCDAMVWRMKPISTKRIIQALTEGPKTIEELGTFLTYQRVKKIPVCAITTAALATIEQMDTVRFKDGKLYLVDSS